MSQELLQASVNLRSPVALDWLDAISESNGILSAILAVIYPKLYDAGWQTINHLGDAPKFGDQDILDQWVSVFSGIGISTVVGIAGKVLEHAVLSFKEDRVYYAYFMRDNVHE